MSTREEFEAAHQAWLDTANPDGSIPLTEADKVWLDAMVEWLRENPDPDDAA